MARKKKATAENTVETLTAETMAAVPIADAAEVLEVLNSSDDLNAVITEPDASEKHVALRQLYIVKEYIDDKVKNAGGGSGGGFSDSDFATKEEIRNIFK